MCKCKFVKILQENLSHCETTTCSDNGYYVGQECRQGSTVMVYAWRIALDISGKKVQRVTWVLGADITWRLVHFSLLGKIVKQNLIMVWMRTATTVCIWYPEGNRCLS